MQLIKFLSSLLHLKATKEHEILVRKIKNNLFELWYTFEREMNEIKSRSTAEAENIDGMMARLATQQQYDVCFYFVLSS